MAKFGEEFNEKQKITWETIREAFHRQETVTDKIYFVALFPFRMVLFFFLRQFYLLRSRYFEKNPQAERRARVRKWIAKRRAKRMQRDFIEKDKQLAARMIHMVNRIDHRNDALAAKAADAAAEGTKQFNLAAEWAELNKRKLLLRFGAVVAVLLLILGALNFCTAYEYAYNGRALGLVRDQEDVLRILDLVSEQLTEEHHAEISISSKEEITFQRVFALGKEIDNMEKVLSRLSYMQDLVAHGCGIFIDGKRVAIVDNEETAKSVLDAVLATFAVPSDATTYEEIGFAEEIQTKKITTKLGLVEHPDAVIQKILTGAEEIKTHTVAAGETLSGIAKKYQIKLADLQAANPLVNPARLSIGQQIVLTQAVPMLTVQTVEISTLTEYIDYPIVYENSASIYQGETSTKVAGKKGERQVLAKIVKNNGMEVARLELESQITKEPVTSVVLVGTKELPLRQGTGTFIYPVTGAKLSSGFGRRWGRMHYGIDLAISKGTKIRASDGGTVIFSGYSGSYGYVVKIDHGGGFVTVYAHCSKLHVKVGEKVYQGQHIANVGSTGRSTGPHCHFEVQYLGVQKNPLNYL